jgi:hypothetical protein
MIEGEQVSKKYCFVIGAAKCGTTALADMLDTHPDIDVSTPKETNFFTDPGIKKGFDWYESRFPQNSEATYRVDASVSYSAGWEGGSENIAERIAKFSPDAKIIYVIRDPIERTRSAYWHAVRSGYEHNPLWDAIQNPDIDHITASQYINRIEDYLNFFKPENIQVISAHTLRSDTFETINFLCEFLGVEKFKSLNVQQDTNSTYQLSGIGKQLHRILPRSVIKSTVKRIKQTLPKPIITKLQNIYSKPIPPLTEKEAFYLYKAFCNEVDLVKNRYEIDLKHCKWWKHFENT